MAELVLISDLYSKLLAKQEKKELCHLTGSFFYVKIEYMGSHYKDIYDQDFDDKGISSGWIQWKGTNICMDIYCICGAIDHVDDEFFYSYECKDCGVRYAVGQNVKLIPLTKEQEEDYNW